MPIFELVKDNVFPDPELAENNGIIAIGGDLKPGRLLQAYRMGIFPWFNENDPIVWWSPDPRMVLHPSELRVSHSLRKILKERLFEVTYDNDFEAVIENCKAQKRPGQKGTWITKEIKEAYIRLHRLGYAHSVEVYKDGIIVGGLYGLSLGSMFSGESMFSKVSNASKTGFIILVKKLHSIGFTMIDCQIYTRHLASLGAKEISRKKYLRELDSCLEKNTFKGNWGTMSMFQKESFANN